MVEAHLLILLMIRWIDCTIRVFWSVGAWIAHSRTPWKHTELLAIIISFYKILFLFSDHSLGRVPTKVPTDKLAGVSVWLTYSKLACVYLFYNTQNQLVMLEVYISSTLGSDLDNYISESIGHPDQSCWPGFTSDPGIIPYGNFYFVIILKTLWICNLSTYFVTWS